jgi:hypothetical protein
VKQILVTTAILFIWLIAQGAYANPHRLVFDSAYKITAPNVSVFLPIVKEKLKKGQWVSQLNVKKKAKMCTMALEIEGRDIALVNPKIGEHYLGTVKFTCKEGVFKFDRATILGIRDCVQSETMGDSDYCKLQVIAYRSDADIANREKFFRLGSEKLLTEIENQGLKPDGLNIDYKDSALIFDLSLDRDGKEFFMSSESPPFEGVARGRNYTVHTEDNCLTQDEDTARMVKKSIETAYGHLEDAQAQAEVGEFESRMIDAVFELSAALQKALSIISPSVFSEVENKLKVLEADLVEISTKKLENVGTRQAFVSHFQSFVDSYSKYAAYLDRTRYDRQEGLFDSGSSSGNAQTTKADHVDLTKPLKYLPPGTKLILKKPIVIPAGGNESSLGERCYIFVYKNRHDAYVIERGTVLYYLGWSGLDYSGGKFSYDDDPRPEVKILCAGYIDYLTMGEYFRNLDPYFSVVFGKYERANQ